MTETRPVFEPLGARIHGQGPQTLVLGNGFGTVQSIWRPLVQDLCADYRVVTFDPAGCGEGQGAWQRSRHARMDGYAEDLLGLLEHLDLGPVLYVGHSFSAMVGVLAANAEPELFQKLVLIGASARYLDDAPAGYVGGMQPQDVDAVLEAMRADYAAWANGFAKVHVGNADHPDLAARFESSLRNLRPDIALAVIDMILHSDCRTSCVELGCKAIPTLLLQTFKDAVVPREATVWLAQALRAQWRELDLEGHFPHLLRPALLAQQIRQFLD